MLRESARDTGNVLCRFWGKKTAVGEVHAELPRHDLGPGKEGVEMGTGVNGKANPDLKANGHESNAVI